MSNQSVLQKLKSRGNLFVRKKKKKMMKKKVN